jgi:hypothetical protein
MTLEVSRYDIERLQASHRELEKEVRRLRDELRASDARHFDRTCEMEPRLTKWSTILFGMSLAFTLLVAICAKHVEPASSERAVEASANTG